MKKLAILAAAAIGYALANRVGRKQDLGFSGPAPVRPNYEPAGTDPFVASAHEVPLRVVEDLPEEPVVDEVAPEPVLDVPVLDEEVLDEAVLAEPVLSEQVLDEPDLVEEVLDEPVAVEAVADETADEVEDTDSALTDNLGEEPAVDDVFAPVDADSDALTDAATDLDDAIEAELDAEPAIAPLIEDIIPSTPVADTHETPEVTNPYASEFDEAPSETPVETPAEVERVSPPTSVEETAAETETSTASSYDSWFDYVPPPAAEEHEPATELASEPATEPEPEANEDSASTPDAAPERKLSEIAEGINERIRTAADLAREEEPAVEILDDLDDEQAASDEEPRPEAFVVPTAEDFAGEVFEDEVSAVAETGSDLGDTALMDAIDDEADKS